MKIIETKSTNLLSILIRWALNCKGSHIAFVFDNDTWLIHSNLIGVNIRLYNAFFKAHLNTQIVDQIEIHLEPQDEEEVFQALIQNTSEQSYDWPGFTYFAFRALAFKLFKIPLPRKNAWGRSNMQLCTEMIRQLPTWITNIDPMMDLGIVSPDRAMEILREAQ